MRHSGSLRFAEGSPRSSTPPAPTAQEPLRSARTSGGARWQSVWDTYQRRGRAFPSERGVGRLCGLTWHLRGTGATQRNRQEKSDAQTFNSAFADLVDCDPRASPSTGRYRRSFPRALASPCCHRSPRGPRLRNRVLGSSARSGRGAPSGPGRVLAPRYGFRPSRRARIVITRNCSEFRPRHRCPSRRLRRERPRRGSRRARRPPPHPRCDHSPEAVEDIGDDAPDQGVAAAGAHRALDRAQLLAPVHRSDAPRFKVDDADGPR